MGDEERSSRGRGRSRSRTRSKSRTRTQKSEKRDSKKDKRSKHKRRSKRQREQIERRKPVGSFLQGYLDDAIATAATAMSIFEVGDDFESQMSDEFSFESSHSHSTGQGEKYSASDDSVEVAAVATEQERKIIQHQQPDIATFRLKRNGRPYAVKKLVKQLEREEQKRLKAALALEEAEERMWKTKWKLYNLAEELDLLCGNINSNENDVEDEDALYDTDSFNSFTDDR